MVRSQQPVASLRAFTIIELLIVIAIISLLLSILLPSLSQAREESRRTVCQSNMRMIGAAVNGYLGNDGEDNLPWTFIAGLDPGPRCILPYTSDDGRTVRVSSSYTWGGMISPRPFAGEGSYDYCLVPPDIRPLNTYMNSGASGKADVKSVQCPGDRSSVSPFMNRELPALQIESSEPSWARFGNSYSINWMFMDEPDLTNWQLCDLLEHGKHAVRMNQGGKASEWVIMWENQCDQLFLRANLVGESGRIGPGWHRRFSYHTFLFLDGHADHRFYDTRNARGPNWRVFRKWRLFNQPPFLDPPWG